MDVREIVRTILILIGAITVRNWLINLLAGIARRRGG